MSKRIVIDLNDLSGLVKARQSRLRERISKLKGKLAVAEFRLGELIPVHGFLKDLQDDTEAGFRIPCSAVSQEGDSQPNTSEDFRNESSAV